MERSAVQLKFKSLYFSVLVSLLISQSAFAVEKTTLPYQNSAFRNESDDWELVTQPAANRAWIEYIGPYQEAQSILLLGDSFLDAHSITKYSLEELKAKDSYSIAEMIEPDTKPETKIYKTSLDCPEEKSGKSEGKIHSLKLDHTQPFPFHDQEFDLIVMRRGLCFCESSLKTCGGLELGPETELFFQEVVRTLNSGNPKAAAYIEGSFLARLGRGKVAYEQEQVYLNRVESLLRTLEERNPHLKFEMIYRSRPLSYFIFATQFDFDLILDADGIPYTEKFDLNPETFKISFEQFDGVKISVR